MIDQVIEVFVLVIKPLEGTLNFMQICDQIKLILLWAVFRIQNLGDVVISLFQIWESFHLMYLEQLINFMLIFILFFRHKSCEELRLPVSIWVLNLLLTLLLHLFLILAISYMLLVFFIAASLVNWGFDLTVFIKSGFVLCQELILQLSFMMSFQRLEFLRTVRCSAIRLHIQEVFNLLVGLFHDLFLFFLLSSCKFFGTLLFLFRFGCTWCIEMRQVCVDRVFSFRLWLTFEKSYFSLLFILILGFVAFVVQLHIFFEVV